MGALATTAPAGSETVPVMVPRSLWANAHTASNRQQTESDKNLMTLPPKRDQTSQTEWIGITHSLFDHCGVTVHPRAADVKATFTVSTDPAKRRSLLDL